MSAKMRMMPVLTFLLLLAGVATVLAADFNEDFAFKISLENHLERRLKQMITEITGNDRGVVIVNADIGSVRSGDLSRGRITKKKSRDALILPGVPVKKQFGTGLSETAELLFPGAGGSKYKVNKIVLAIWLDRGISEPVVALVRDLAKQVIGFNEKRGDKVNIQLIDFKRNKFYWKSVFYPENLYLIILGLIAAIFLLTASLFLRDPFSKLSSALNNIDWDHLRGTSGTGEMLRAGSEMQNSTLAHEPSEELEQVKAGESPPFSFVSEKDLPSLLFLLKNMPAEDIATVANYLDAALATRLLESFSPEIQSGIAIYLSSEKIDPEKVRSLENTLKEQISYVIGGERKLVSILRMASEEVKDRAIGVLEKRDRDSAENLKKKVKGFEETIRDLPSQGIQVIYRRTNPVLFAQILKASSEDVRKKVMDSISEGAAERLKQEIELSPPLLPRRLQREKVNLMIMVNRFIDEGIIEGVNG
ncbi:flagellar motor switch protein FliG [bacterium BMS3Abin07]|nr:flagellar motor switch protein FliG [bacterium BMS3Abin07]GBE33279.1 flagellar motor switch protein FliG [bacterium BMS3Bbin05]HDL19815.1 hypothetical protein [Nitrospirota bacterium]HDO22573.1 hypothetical protein [Nitrospirota bacterium]HDZ87451.1 hypothetical protein [Nitrospirota bacterium]